MRIMNSMIRLSDYYNLITALLRSNRKKLKNLLALPLLLSFIIISCEEDPAQIGGNILPGSDFDSIAAVDTLGVDLYTLYNDTSSSMFTTTTYLGSNYNPYFGLTSANFVSQLWLSTRWPADALGIDSVKMGLAVTKVTGDMSVPAELKIYEVDEMMYADSVYNTNREVPLGEMLASVQMPALPESDEDTIINILLPNSFAEYILRDTASLYLRSDTVDFRNYFNGLYFDYPQTGNYHMLDINLVSFATSITIFYTNTDENARTFQFLMNEKSVRYNRYEHDFEMADADKEIKYINEPVKDTLAYAQSKNGVYTRLVIPGLEQFRSEMPLAVNKARLYIPVYLDQEDYTENMVPDNLLVRYDSAGIKRILTDYLLNPAFLDGSYSKVDNRYEVNIASFVQQYLEGDIAEPAIEIFLPEQSSKNLIMKANRAGDEGIRFELTYTVYK